MGALHMLRRLMCLLSLRFYDCHVQTPALVESCPSRFVHGSQAIWAILRLFWKHFLTGHQSVGGMQLASLNVCVATSSPLSSSPLWNMSHGQRRIFAKVHDHWLLHDKKIPPILFVGICDDFYGTEWASMEVCLRPQGTCSFYFSSLENWKENTPNHFPTSSLN